MKILILDATTKSIQAVMSGAAATTNPDFTASWVDGTTTTFTPGSTDGALNGTTPVTLVAAPGASTQRQIKSLTIQNRDTAAVTVTIQYNNNTTLRQLYKVTLAVNDTFTLDGVYDVNGQLKSVPGSVNLTSQVAGILPPANGGTGVANNAASTLAISGNYATTFTVTNTTGVTLPTTGTLSTLAGTETLTNKTVKRRVLTVTQSATPTVNIDNADIVLITGLAQDITSMSTNLSGTPYDGQLIMWQITGTAARAITWGASFGSTTVTLPATTVTTVKLRALTQYNSANSLHECIATA